MRVAELVIFDKLDRASQCFAQRVDEAEELFERRRIAVWIELDKEVGIAGVKIEIRTTGSRNRRCWTRILFPSVSW